MSKERERRKKKKGFRQRDDVTIEEWQSDTHTNTHTTIVFKQKHFFTFSFHSHPHFLIRHQTGAILAPSPCQLLQFGKWSLEPCLSCLTVRFATHCRAMAWEWWLCWRPRVRWWQRNLCGVASDWLTLITEDEFLNRSCTFICITWQSVSYRHGIPQQKPIAKSILFFYPQRYHKLTWIWAAIHHFVVQRRQVPMVHRTLHVAVLSHVGSPRSLSWPLWRLPSFSFWLRASHGTRACETRSNFVGLQVRRSSEWLWQQRHQIRPRFCPKQPTDINVTGAE